MGKPVSPEKESQQQLIKNFSNLNISHDRLVKICAKYSIAELSLFGSCLRDDFNSETSDIDLLVTFADGSAIGLMQFAGIEQELADIFCRKVDLVSKEAIEGSHNWIRRKEILDSAQVLYAAA